MYDDQAYSEHWHSQNNYSSIFKDMQVYSGILMHIQPHSQVRNQEGRGEALPAYKKSPDCFHLFVKFPIQNVLLRVSSRRNSKSFSCGFFFSCVFEETFIEMPQFYKPPEAYLKSCDMLTRHIQNPAIGYYSAILSHTQNLVQRLHMQRPGILAILEYSELFRNCIPSHIQSYLLTFTNIQNSGIFKTHHVFRTLSNI